MFNINELIENLNKATKITTTLGEYGYKSVSLSFPTNDLDVSYSFYSMGNGHILRWEGMDMINEEIHFTKEDFSVLYIEVLKELLMKTIEQNDEYELEVVPHIRGGLIVSQQYDSTIINKQGASEIIKVLQEWLDE